VVEVATRLGISDKSLYLWLRQSREPTVNHQDVSALNTELNRMRAELKRTTEERDILKKAAAYFAKLSD
jgi:transposase